MKEEKENKFRERISPAKQALFCLAIIFMFLSSTEVCLRFFDWFNPYRAEDPFAGFERDLVPGFIKTDDGSEYTVRNPDIQRLSDVHFPAQVDAGTLRPVLLGGSNVVNFDLALLESAIKESTGYEVSVASAGANSYGSQRLALLAEEALELFDPDLLVIYMGHNEFQERRFYRHLIEESPVIREMRIWLWRLHLYTAIREAVHEARVRTIGYKEKEPWIRPSQRFVLPSNPEFDGIHLNWEESLMTYRHLRFNLKKIELSAVGREIPLLIVTPVSNDLSGPWSPCFHKTITPEDEMEFDRRWTETWTFITSGDRTLRAIRNLEQLESDFGPHAAVQQGLSRLYFALGDSATAVSWHRKSLDSDCSPSMANDRIADILCGFAKAGGHRLLDARAEFRKFSRFGIVGHEFISDHCHLNSEGKEKLFEMIANEIAVMIESNLISIVIDANGRLQGEEIRIPRKQP